MPGWIFGRPACPRRRAQEEVVEEEELCGDVDVVLGLRQSGYVNLECYMVIIPIGGVYMYSGGQGLPLSCVTLEQRTDRYSQVIVVNLMLSTYGLILIKIFEGSPDIIKRQNIIAKGLQISCFYGPHGLSIHKGFSIHQIVHNRELTFNASEISLLKVNTL